MTQRQKQCLLCYLGLYSGPIDGIWGKGSQGAEEDFSRIYGEFTEENLLKALENPADFWLDTPNFRREEFRCKCGGKFCDGFPVEPAERLVRLAQQVREHFEVPVIISSGVRCQVHNQNVGGVPGSRHKLGTAMDFRAEGIPTAWVLAYVQDQDATRYAYDIDGTWIHMDVGEP